MASNIVVTADAPGATRGTLRIADLSFCVALGREGIVRDKREGDGSSPAGRWPLRHIRYRADRIPEPVTVLPLHTISPLDGWSDDVNDPDYNCFVEHPESGPREYSAERLWREDHLYDIILVVGHNDDPPIPGKGSAIFCHLAREDFAPTEGCVAMRLDNMLRLCREVSIDTYLEIRP